MNCGAGDRGAAERGNRGATVSRQHDVVAAGAGVFEVGCVKCAHGLAPGALGRVATGCTDWHKPDVAASHGGIGATRGCAEGVLRDEGAACVDADSAKDSKSGAASCTSPCICND